MVSPNTSLEVGDMTEAAAIRAAGFELIDVRPTGGGRLVFVFDDASGGASSALRSHRCGSLQVPSLRLLESVNSMRTMVVSAREGGSGR